MQYLNGGESSQCEKDEDDEACEDENIPKVYQPNEGDVMAKTMAIIEKQGSQMMCLLSQLSGAHLQASSSIVTVISRPRSWKRSLRQRCRKISTFSSF